MKHRHLNQETKTSEIRRIQKVIRRDVFKLAELCELNFPHPLIADYLELDREIHSLLTREIAKLWNTDQPGLFDEKQDSQ